MEPAVYRYEASLASHTCTASLRGAVYQLVEPNAGSISVSNKY